MFASAVEVPGRGLEPLRISPPDPKSGASANFATLAKIVFILARNLAKPMHPLLPGAQPIRRAKLTLAGMSLTRRRLAGRIHSAGG
jgi:hypothetical protein